MKPRAVTYPFLVGLLLSTPFLLMAAPTRVANSSLSLPADLSSGAFSTTNAFPGLPFTDPVVIVTPPGETNRLFIVEKPGRIAVIPDLSAPTREVFLDITARVRDNSNEEGLLGLAFHPNYNSSGQPGFGEFFVYYQTTITGSRYWRLSRFSVNPNDADRGDPGSEVPIITQRDQAGNHNGGDLQFGGDGYLYVSVGDEGGANDTYDNGQHIDKDFFAAILRLDVDLLAANLAPNAHPAVHSGTYKVPADNPFVGATSFNGSSVAPSAVRTEIWAIGLRNPWRMSFDRPTGRLFVADVGQVSREEINILSPTEFAGNGGIPNYGWSYREGFQAFAGGPGGSTPPTGFSAIDPIHDYNRSLGQSVTGGIVYRGSQYAELTGDYLFADYVSGRIWAMDDPGGTSQSVDEIAVDNGIAAFGQNPVTGDILLADLGSDSIKRLVQSPGSGPQPPQFLSQTGAFSNLANLTPEAGILPYEINHPFWSDYAEKSRWFSIPETNDDMTWSQDANWTFPEGQVWIKHFELELNRDNPGSNRRRIETRFLVKTAGDVYGITYRWNAAQTDAELVEENGTTENFTITENGQNRTQSWIFPGRADCRTCHSPVTGGALSFNTRQLNRSFDYGSGPENQLDALEAAGYFTNAIPAPAGLPEFSDPADESFSLEHRARSFLSTNCVSCHQPGGTALGNWSARPELPLEESGILDSPLSNNGGDPFARTLVPGDPGRSMILQRLHAAASPGTLPPMPPLGSTEANLEGIELLTQWINDLPKVLFVRGADRSGGFLEGSNDAQRTEHLGDINNTTAGGGNHGWGELAATLRNEGFLVEQIAETAENSNGASQGIHIDFENLNLDQYRVIVFGSNNAVYDAAAINAIDDYVRGGGATLFISDANFGGDWADASNSDQQFLDRFGLIMNQDQGTYAKTRGNGEFLLPNHPVFENVDEFHGEGVTPISIGTLPSDVTATVLARAEGQVRRNTPPFGNQNQGSSSANMIQDGALVLATAGDGKVAGHFDRNTFFNQGGVGSDLTRFDNRQYAINLFLWLAETSSDTSPRGLTATNGALPDRIDLAWSPVTEASLYTVYRSTTDTFASASLLTTVATPGYSDMSANYGTSYFYWITATVDSTESSPGPSAEGLRIIAPPEGVSATDAQFFDRIDVSWSAVNNASGYSIFRATTNLFSSASQIGTSASTAFSDTSAIAGITYYYWVTATVGSDESNAGNSDSGSLQLPAPTGLTASDGSSTTEIAISWNALQGASSYQLLRSPINSSTRASVLTTTTSTSFSDSSNLNPARTYYYWVRAIFGTTNGPVSAEETGSIAFSQPGGVTASQGTSSAGVELLWGEVAGATSYRIYRSTTDQFSGATLLGTTTSLAYLDDFATPETTYYYFIEPFNSYGSGPVSEAVSGSRVFELIQPDLLIGKSSGRLIGNNRYNTLSGQKIRVISKGRKPARAFFRIQNDGSSSERIRIAGTKSSSSGKITYLLRSPSSGNVSSAIFIGAYLSSALEASQSELVQVQIKPKRSFKRTSKVLIRAFSTRDSSKRDRNRFDSVRIK
ncbi:MAG: PQQ-dependent sugar dehydrogenase [Verrucomicrobiales bacterium]|nr:PQQ-dependent sugar dehydrogenase [Verrucomicrobiales bacterium]